MTPYKGEFGCFAAYVRTQQSAFSVRTYAAIDRKRVIYKIMTTRLSEVVEL